MTRVLSVTSECVPFIKTGGLADVAGALPEAMAGKGWDMRTVLPGYPAVKAAIKRGRTVLREDDLFGGTARLLSAKVEGLHLYVIDAPHLYERSGGPYLDDAGVDWPDNPERFAALSWMAARIATEGIGAWRPKLCHIHDWQAGLTPVYIDEMGARGEVGCVLTIHNIAFHGLAPANKRATLRLPTSGFTQGGYEFWNQISALKAGIVWSDKITTVSPAYARELLRPEFGFGLDGILRARETDLSGILNGIDTGVWNPETDPAVACYKSPAGKKKAKQALRSQFNLPPADGPLAVVVSRLSEQKGLDMLLQALPALLDRGGQLVLLGSGDKRMEWEWSNAANHPHVAAWIGYDEALSHQIIAGGDAIIVPSRFEPCGLTQMYGLRYGTVPVVARTGGLADTIIDANPTALRTGVATGLQFDPVTADGLARALLRLCDLYADPKVFAQIQRNGMKQELGWDMAAAEYAALYDQVIRS